MKAGKSLQATMAIATWVACATTLHAVTVDIGSTPGAPGTTVSFAVSLNGSSEAQPIVAFANQIGFDAAAPIAAGLDGKPDCSLTPGITKPNTGFTFQPRNCVPGSTCTSVNAIVISLEPDTADTPLPTGPIYTCRVAISPAAVVDTTYALTNLTATIADLQHVDTDVTANSQSGGISVTAPTPTPTLAVATASPTSVSPSATLTVISVATATATPIATNTATPSPTSTPSATETPSVAPTSTAVPTASATPAPCVGDCTNDGEVTIDDILNAIDVALGSADLSTCRAGDANKDDHITVDEVLTAVNHAIDGCH